MNFYECTAEEVVKCLTEFGMTCTFTNEGKSGFDPSTGQATTSAPTNYDVLCIRDTFSKDEKASTAILEADIKLFTEAMAFTVGDKTTLNGVSYRIQKIDPIQPADVPVASWVILRA